MVLLALLWISYFSLHSLLALDRVKQFTQQKRPTVYRYYRLFYNAISGLGFVGIGWYQISLPSQKLLMAPIWLPYAAWTVMLLGFVGVWLAFRSYNTREFIGLEQLESPHSSVQDLHTDGLNRYVRHPLYTGTLVAIGGYCLIKVDTVSIMVAGIWLAYIIVGSHLEEKKLVRIYGKAYLDYQKRVKMLIPYVL